MQMKTWTESTGYVVLFLDHYGCALMIDDKRMKDLIRQTDLYRQHTNVAQLYLCAVAELASVTEYTQCGKTEG